MKRSYVILAVLAATLIASAQAQQQTAPQPGPAEVVLLVGPNRYEAAIGESVTILTPGGERVPIVVQQKQTLHYLGDGLSFDYPRQLQLSTENQPGVDMIYLRSQQTPLAIIQSYSAPGSPPEVRRTLVAGLVERFKAGGAQFAAGSGRMTEAKIGRSSQPGQALDYVVNGIRMKTEVYAFRHGERVIAMVLQYGEEDADAAGRMFSVVMSSFR